MAGPIITLITDFGTGSSYVAQLKAALWSNFDDARIVDVSHDIEPQNIVEAAELLRSIAFAFGEGATHLVVVDPGVGTSRRGLAIQSRGSFFVGPDNGVLSVALEQPMHRAVEIDAPHLYRKPVSKTFHGRDIFAPVAAELAAGLPLDEIGPALLSPVLLSRPTAEVRGDQIVGEVLYADPFGNLITNIDSALSSDWATAVILGTECERVETYGQVKPGELCALVGSSGRVEVAVAMGSAAERLGADAFGARVSLTN